MEIREATLPADIEAIRRLWLEYLTWGNAQLEALFGFRLPVEPVVDQDLASIAKFRPPAGHLLLATEGSTVFGIAALRTITPGTSEIKRMYVQPSHRGAGAGRALLDALVDLATGDGFQRVRLDSAAFMSAAHRLYRGAGFTEIGAYPESEIPELYRDRWVFMERTLLAELT